MLLPIYYYKVPLAKLTNSSAKRLASRLIILSKIFLGIVIILIPFRYRILLKSRPVGNIYGDYTDFILFGHDIALLILLAFWTLAKFLRKERFSRGPFVLTIPLVAFTIWIAIFAFASIDPSLSYYHSLRAVLLLGLYFYLVDNTISLESLFPWIGVQIVIQAVPGLFQLYYQRDLGLQTLGEYRLRPEWAGVSIIFNKGDRWLRAYGFSDHPNILGGSLAIGVLILVGWYLLGSVKQSSWLVVVVLIGSATLFATFSRSAWLAFLLGVAVLIFFTNRSQMGKRLVPLMIALILGIVPLVISYEELFQTRLQIFGQAEISPTEIQSIGERVFLNQASQDIFLNNPILGVGFGSLPQALRLEHPVIQTYYQPAHFVWLTAAAETGLIGSTFYMLAVLLPLIVFSFNRRLHKLPAIITVTVGLLTISVIGLFDYYPWLLTTGRLWQYLLWGVWAGEYQKATKEQQNE